MVIVTTDIQLFQILKQKLGEKEAEALVSFVDARIKEGNDSNTKTLTTKEDMSHLRAELKGEMSHLRVELKEDMSHLRAEFKEDMSHLRAELKEDNANLRAELKEDSANLRAELKEDIANLRAELKTEIAASKAEIIKWMFIFWIGQIVVTFGFILLFLNK